MNPFESGSNAMPIVLANLSQKGQAHSLLPIEGGFGPAAPGTPQLRRIPRLGSEAAFRPFFCQTRGRRMPQLIPTPTRIEAAGTKPKKIDEFVGRVNTGTETLSVAHMRSPSGWVEPGQTPEFDEYTVVIHGALQVESKDGVLTVAAGQAVLTRAGEWIRYSTPGPDGAEYIAICLPAFSPATVHRDDA